MNGGIAETLLDEGVPMEDIEKFFQVYGGLPLYIPKHFDPVHAIAAEVGTVLAKTLSNIYGGTQPVIPTGEELRRQKMRLRVRQLCKDGKNSHEIARQCRLHLRQVYRIVSGMDPADRPSRDHPDQTYFCGCAPSSLHHNEHPNLPR